jgi:ribonuclease P/MRP protein subunit POP5
MKGKPLLPTLRTKKRYVVYEVLADKELEPKKVVDAIFASFRECFGIFGLGKAELKDMRIYNKNKGILKVSHKYVDELRTALAMVKDIDKLQVILHTVGTSGILKKAKTRL